MLHQTDHNFIIYSEIKRSDLKRSDLKQASTNYQQFIHSPVFIFLTLETTGESCANF